MTTPRRQLISYFALGAPATRLPASGREPRIRPEIGFTPDERVRALLELCEEFSRSRSPSWCSFQS